MSENVFEDINIDNIPSDILAEVKYEKDEGENNDLCNEVILSYCEEQSIKQEIYGLLRSSDQSKNKWYVPYKEFRDAEKEIASGYFTPEEREQIARENFNLIHSVAQRNKPHPNNPLYTIEDIYDACYEGFSRALVNYNKFLVKTKFSTYVVASMNNCCIDLIRSAGAKGRKETEVYSLDYSYNEDDGEENTLMDLYIDEEDTPFDDVEDYSVSREVCEKLIEGLDDMQKLIACHSYGILGYEKLTQLEISQTFFVTKKSVTESIKQIGEHFAKKIEELGITFEDIFG